MLRIGAPDVPLDVPPIVLLVDAHRDTVERYSRSFEEGGFWVATSCVASEALDAIEDLKPDVIIVDADAAADDGAVLFDAVKNRLAARAVPLILLSSTGRMPAADAVLVKPVVPAALLQCARDLLAHARSVRGKSDEVVGRGRALLQRSSQLRATSERLAGERESRERRCPRCGGRLDWVEQGTIGGIRYDYYRGCVKGCGLYCFDLTAGQWVRLA